MDVRLRTYSVVVSGLLAAVALSACASTDGASQSQQLPACPQAWAGVTKVSVLMSDSGSERSQQLVDERINAALAAVRTAAACRVTSSVKWVPSQTQATELYSGNPWHDGANDTVIARLTNKNIADTVEPAIRSGIQQATATPASAQSSPAGLLQVAAEDRGSDKTAIVVLSDMVQHTSDIDLNQEISVKAAQAAAQQVPIPDLSGSPVAIYGVAMTSDAVGAPDDWAAAIRAFATTLCERSKASSCVVRTQYPSDEAGV